MKTNRYTAAMLAEKIDEQKFEELRERLKMIGEAPDTVSGTEKRRSKPKLAAILAAVMAATVICATTAVAVGIGGWRMREFYRDNKSKGFTMMENPDEHTNDTEITAVSEVSETNPSAKFEPKLVSVASDGHTIVAIIEVDIKNLGLPEEAINNGSIGFYSANSSILGVNNYLPTLISEEGTVYSYACGIAPIRTIPEDGVTIELQNFGYDIGNGFEIAVGGIFKFDIDSESIDTLDDNVKISAEMQVKGATLQLQLNPLGLLVYGSYSELEELGLYDDKYFLSQGNCFKFRMSDGSILGDEEDFYDTDFYQIISSVTGWVDFDNDIAYHHYGFIIPVDISEIEAIAVHDVWFELESENTKGTVTENE